MLDGDGRDHLAKAGVRIGRLPIHKGVQLRLGDAPVSITPGRIALPVTWKAEGGPPLFPRMEGILHVEPLTADLTKLTLSASYDPPLGPIGQLLDKAALHHLAEATFRDFLDRLASRLDVQISGRTGV